MAWAIARLPSAGPTRVKQSHAEMATCIARGVGALPPTSSEANRQTAVGNVQRILASGGDDPRVPVKRRIRRATAHRLMQGGNQIVEPVAFIIKARASLAGDLGQQFRLQHPLARVIAFWPYRPSFPGYSALAARVASSLARQWPCGSHPAKRYPRRRSRGFYRSSPGQAPARYRRW